MATLTALPDSFPAGTTVKYTRTVSDYPATSGWTLKLILAGPGVLTVTAAASGGDYAVTVTAAQSAALAAGVYRWAEEVSKAAEVFRVGDGTVSVEPNMTTAAPGDLQSEDEKQLVLVKARIAELHAKGIVAYSVDGVTVTKTEPRDLYAERARLQLAIARAKRGGGIGRQFRVAFTGAKNE
jgi:hypothetical protein